MPLGAAITIGAFPGGVRLGSALAPGRFLQVLTAVSLLQHAKIVKAFREGGHQSRGGTRWAPWSSAHAKRQRSRGRAHVLIDTGRLRNTIRAYPEQEGTHRSIVIRADAPYAAFHQYGTRTMPARPVIEITDSDVAEAARMIGVLADRLLNGA